MSTHVDSRSRENVSASSLLHTVRKVTFERGQKQNLIARIDGVVCFPASTWQGKPPLVGETLEVCVVDIAGSRGKQVCLVVPQEELDSQTPGTSHTPPPAPTRDEVFSLDLVPPGEVVEVRFRYRGKRLLGNYQGRALDPDSKVWGAPRQPKVKEKWLVQIVPRDRQEIYLARAVKGPLNVK